ncbi:hypothetical protein BDY24DRAFT_81283 [Mrakia frigida]|uniref:uncharacterized protein n=1 Tax=Mrakia frigida TaxID=29902 RepID=UPI003FCBF2C3
MFIVLISLFVVTTSIPLIVIMCLQYTGSKRFGVHLSDTGIWANWLLQPQAILSELVLLGTAIHAIRTRNMIAIILVLCFNIYLVIAGFLEAAQRQPDLLTYTEADGSTISEFYISNVLLWTVPALDLCFHLGCDYSALKLYRELGWLAYKKSSADVALSKLYHNVLILRSMALFSTVFAFIEFYTVAVLTIAAYPIAIDVLDVRPQPGKIVAANVSAGVLVACWTFGALPLYLGMKKESRKLLGISLGVQTLGMAVHYASGVILLDLLTMVVKKAKETGQDAFAAAQSSSSFSSPPSSFSFLFCRLLPYSPFFTVLPLPLIPLSLFPRSMEDRSSHLRPSHFSFLPSARA